MAQQLLHLGSLLLLAFSNVMWMLLFERVEGSQVICISDNQGRFITAQTQWSTPLLRVREGQAFGLLSALRWAVPLELDSVIFELGSKQVVDNVLGLQVSSVTLIQLSSFAFISSKLSSEIYQDASKCSGSLLSKDSYIQYYSSNL